MTKGARSIRGNRLNNKSVSSERRLRRPGGKFAATGILLALVGARVADSSVQAFHRTYGPKTSLLVSAPTLQWEVWPSEGARVTSAEMRVNGDQVDAVYNSKLRRLEYHPSRPFLAGTYRVQCLVRVDDRLEVRKDWTFQVSTNATPVLLAPSATQDAGLAEINAYRAKLGLEPAVQEDRLNAASLAHVKYLSQNNRTGHFEKPGEPGFVGATPSDRLEAFGYVGGSWECVTYNSGNVQDSVRDLFNAPYHRIPFLQPGELPVGTGMAGRNFSIKFGEGGKTGLTVSPADGQRGVPTSWDGNERPNPLRMHNSPQFKVGYPIVVSCFEDQAKLIVEDAWLKVDGVHVGLFVNSSENDDQLDNSIFLIPKKPLVPGKEYHVYLRASANGKSSIRKEWKFTTAP